MIIFWSIILIASIFVLVRSSDYFTESAERIGIYLGMPAFLVGVTIVAIGTSLPELIVSIISVIKGSSELVTGNIIGSNIANIFLVLGLLSIFAKKVSVNHDIVKVDLPILVSSAFAFTIMIYDGKFTLFESLLSIAIAVIYLFYVANSRERKKKEQEIKKDVKKDVSPKKSLWEKDFFSLILTAVLIYIGAKYTVESVIQIAEILNIGKEIIALTAVAIGTSLPELMVSISALKRGSAEIALGNILGSNIFNVSSVIGISGLFGSILIPHNIIIFSLPVMIIATLLYFFIAQDKEITMWEGMMFLVLYILFVAKIITSA